MIKVKPIVDEVDAVRFNGSNSEGIITLLKSLGYTPRKIKDYIKLGNSKEATRIHVGDYIIFMEDEGGVIEVINALDFKANYEKV